MIPTIIAFGTLMLLGFVAYCAIEVFGEKEDEPE